MITKETHLIEVEEKSSPLDPPSLPLKSSSELAGEPLGCLIELGCGLLGRGETESKSEEGAVEVVGRRRRGETGEVMVDTGEKGEESWSVFNGSIGPRRPCRDPRPLFVLLT